MQATQKTLIQQVSEVMQTVGKVFPTVNLATPSVGFYYKSRVAGKAYYMQNKVEFNVVLAKENAATFKNTVIHEVAHLVTHKLYPFAKAHGPEFKSIMRRLGGNGERCHNYDVSSVSAPRDFEYKCGCMSHKVSARKHANMQRAGAKYTCRRCKCPVVYVGKNQQVTKPVMIPVVKPVVTKPVTAKHVATTNTGAKSISTKGNYANGTIMYCEKRGKYVAFHGGKIEVRGSTVEKAKALYIQKFGFPLQFVIA